MGTIMLEYCPPGFCFTTKMPNNINKIFASVKCQSAKLSWQNAGCDVIKKQGLSVAAEHLITIVESVL